MGRKPGPTRGVSRRLMLAGIGGMAAVTVSGGHRTGSGSAAYLSVDEMRGGFQGRVVDALTDASIRDAHVRAEGTDASARVDAHGFYQLPLPAGTYTLHVEAPGYIASSRVRQRAVDGVATTVDFVLLRTNLSPDEEARAYDRLVTQTEAPLVDPPSDGRLAAASLTNLPTTVKVRFPDGHEECMDLEEYLKGVVPYEVPASWPTEALKAQAIAARCYAINRQLSYGYICTTAACQVYGDLRYASTNAAVEATRGVIAAYGDNVIWSFYFSRCNSQSTRNSENAYRSSDGWKTCVESGWNYVAYCRAVSCGGHSPYSSSCGYFGHGVGMCQWGAWARAAEGWDAASIVRHYYSGTAIVSIAGSAAESSSELGSAALSYRVYLPSIVRGQAGSAC